MVTDSLTAVAFAGVAAGLGVAMPLGAIGVLLLREGMHGWRGAAAGATAVAVVDLLYAAAASVLGPVIAEPLRAVEAWVRLVAATVLVLIALYGVMSLRRTRAPAGALPARGGVAGDREAATGAPEATVSAAPEATGDGAREAADETLRRPSAAGAFLRFGGLTLINPTTALYFAALTTAQGARLGADAAATSIFVAGVFAASFLWQQVLAAAGALAGARLAARARLATHMVGYGLVVGYAVALALPLPGAAAAR